MRPLYEELADDLEIYQKVSTHVGPHIHKSMELVYVTEGSLEIGIGQELFHMEKGDFAIVFPSMIHHFQVFDGEKSSAIHILASISYGGKYLQTMQAYCPKNPVISKEKVHPDMRYCIHSLTKYNKDHTDSGIDYSLIQILLGRSMPFFDLVSRGMVESDDLIDQAVSYIAAHFREPVNLMDMARDLYVNPYRLSRVFSSTFHMNFNSYLNETRLEYATNLLEYSKEPITEIYENAGFESQRTFNRVFKERFHMTPRQYRNSKQKNEK